MKQLTMKPHRIVIQPGSAALITTWTNTADAIVAATPTLMSCPPDDAVTSVMPIEMITSSEAPKRIFGMFPYSAPFINEMLK